MRASTSTRHGREGQKKRFRITFSPVPFSLVRAARSFGNACAEAVLESAADVLEVTHAPGTCGPSSLGLLAPVKPAHMPGGITARGARLLLVMKGTTATSSA